MKKHRNGIQFVELCDNLSLINTVINHKIDCDESFDT